MTLFKNWLKILLIIPWLLSANAFADDLKKVVYHVDFEDPDRYSATLTSINNMLDAYENDLTDYDISIVFVGQGTRFVTDNPKAGVTPRLKERQTELKERTDGLHSIRKVKLSVCNNSLIGFGLTKDDLYPGVEIVPSGVVQLAKLQDEGASYIKIQ